MCFVKLKTPNPLKLTFVDIFHVQPFLLFYIIFGYWWTIMHFGVVVSLLLKIIYVKQKPSHLNLSSSQFFIKIIHYLSMI